MYYYYYYSIFIGLFVGLVIEFCYSFRNAEIHGPNSNVIKQNVYLDSRTNKCFKFKTVAYVCAPSKNTFLKKV